MSGLFLDDIEPGQIFETRRHTVTKAEIIDFAKAFDPNAFHLDDAAARTIGLPGIIASGFHTLSLSFRLFFDLKLYDENALMPSPGLDTIRWLKPLRPDDTILVRATAKEVTASRSKPDRGVVRLLHETVNVASREVILTAECMHRVRRRAT